MVDFFFPKGKGKGRENSPGYRRDVSGFDGKDGYLLDDGLLVNQDCFGEQPC